MCLGGQYSNGVCACVHAVCVCVCVGVGACAGACVCLKFCLSFNFRHLSDYSDSAVSSPVTCVDTVTVHLLSQCSGVCSDVQETAEVQS